MPIALVHPLGHYLSVDYSALCHRWLAFAASILVAGQRQAC